MKKYIALLLILVCAGAFAAPMTITYLFGGLTKYPNGPVNGFSSIDEKLFADFQKSHPGVKISPILIDLSTGSTLSIDAMVAAGTAPDVYNDFGGRVGKYMVPEYALDLTPYVDISEYSPSMVSYCMRGNKLYAIPSNSWAQTMAVNMDMLASIGYTLPSQKDWTIDAYLDLAKKLKAKGIPVTYLFAKNQSSDGWWMPWFFAFGGNQYTNGDYSHTNLNSPQSVKALKFLKSLVDNGYSNPYPGESDDDMALEAWATGKVATLAMQAGHAGPAVKAAVDQKLIDKGFTYKFIEFPHVPSIAHTPASAGPSLVLVHKSNDSERNKLNAEFAHIFTGKEFGTILSEIAKNYPSNLLATPKIDDPAWAQIAEVVKTAGALDSGITSPHYSEVRAQLFPLMQEMYAGRMTPEQVLISYEKTVNAILSK